MLPKDALEYLSELNAGRIRLSLGPVSRLLNRLGNPQEQYRTVIVGGTNGKGSIASMISSVLFEGGVKVGLYTSPHLVDIRERIKINNCMIPTEELTELIEETRLEVKEKVTYFEFITTLAFLYFYRRNVDVAVLEVGMGGRLDATNIAIPEVSVISNISLEHTAYLGRSLDNIAWEKGGIIKAGGVCITGVRQKRALKVLENICHERGARLYKLGKDIKVRKMKDGTFCYKGIGKDYTNLACSLIGRHQMKNAAVAIGAIELLQSGGFAIDDSAIARGLKNVEWEGRLEVLHDSPLLVVDGAHNPAGASVLCRALREDFSYRKLIIIFGVLDDKNYKAMLKKLAPLADRVILTKPKEERALHPEDILPIANLYTGNVEVIEDSEQALSRGFDIAKKDDLICVTGSLFLVGEIKKLFLP